MPRLPRVALHEAEAAGVGGEPAVGGRRSQVQLGGAAVQRAAGRRHPRRVGVGGEQARLLGVGAEARVDDERQPGAPRRGGHQVEGAADVGAHPLPVAIGERARVAAAARLRRHPRPIAARQSRLGDGRRDHGDASQRGRILEPGAARQLARIDLGRDLRARSQRGHRLAVGEGEEQPRGIDAVPSRRLVGRAPRAGEIPAARNVARVRRSIGQPGRRQQPRQLVAHAARGRERGEVRGPLHPGLAGDRAADRDQHQADAEQDGGGAQDRRAAPDLARPAAPVRRAPSALRARRPAAPRRARAGPPAPAAAASSPWRGIRADAIRSLPAPRVIAPEEARPGASRRGARAHPHRAPLATDRAAGERSPGPPQQRRPRLPARPGRRRSAARAGGRGVPGPRPRARRRAAPTRAHGRSRRRAASSAASPVTRSPRPAGRRRPIRAQPQRRAPRPAQARRERYVRRRAR